MYDFLRAVRGEAPLLSGVSVAMKLPPSYEMLAATGLVAESTNTKLLTSMVPPSIPSLNVAVTTVLTSTPVAPLVGVTDTTTGKSRSYFNPLGQLPEPITDTAAFATCP